MKIHSYVRQWDAPTIHCSAISPSLSLEPWVFFRLFLLPHSSSSAIFHDSKDFLN